VSSLYKLFTETKISPNITQSGAISMLCSFDDKPDRIEKLALAASKLFEVTVEKNISLLTIRHYNDAIVQQMTAGKNILLLQKTKETIQVLMGL
jgi:aspartate kinase